MNHEKITIYDVAQHANVAISTVSRVLNNSTEVSDATRKKVNASIEVLGFRPHRMAKMLAQQYSHTLSVAMPSFTALFYNEMLKGIKDTLRDHSFDLFLCDLSSSAPIETLSRFFQRGAVDALLLAYPALDDSVMYELKLLKAPVVLVGMKHPDFDCFYWDDEAGAQIAVEHLIEQGHRKIGMIAPHEWSSETIPRSQGYHHALDQAGIPFDASLVETGLTLKHAGHSEEAGYEAMQSLLVKHPDLTAVFASSDVQAIGALSVLREIGRSDIAIIGYDDIKVSRFLGLSSINQKMYQVGREATLQVLKRLQEPNTPLVSHFIEPELQIRSSTQKSAPN
jgi:LacI family transcriptional regulator